MTNLIDQIMNYLKATSIEVGILLNFGEAPDFKRFIYTIRPQEFKIFCENL